MQDETVFMIRHRDFAPHYYEEKQQPPWNYNPNRMISEETAAIFAKSGHRPCNGKGWLEYSNPGGKEYSVFCTCAIKNYHAFGNFSA